MFVALVPMEFGGKIRMPGEAVPEVVHWDETTILGNLLAKRIEYRDERGVNPFRGPGPGASVPVGERPGARASLPQQPPAASRKRDRGAA